MSIFSWKRDRIDRSRLTEDGHANKMELRGLDEHGRELPDPTPVAPPIGYKRQPSMVELVRDMVRSEQLRQAALAADQESFEDADDFDVDDDPQELKSGWENDFDPPLEDLLKAGREELARKAAAAAGKPAEKAGGEGGQSPPSDDPLSRAPS